MTIRTHSVVSDGEARKQLRIQLSQYLAQQSESTRSVDRWMKRLEVASLLLYIATFINALVTSINWEKVPISAIPASWFLFVASALPTLLLFGVHAILIKAYPAVVLPGKPGRFVTGDPAVQTGWILVIGSIVGAAVWGYLTYRIWTSDYATMGAILGVVIGVGITVTLLVSIIQTLSRHR